MMTTSDDFLGNFQKVRLLQVLYISGRSLFMGAMWMTNESYKVVMTMRLLSSD